MSAATTAAAIELLLQLTTRLAELGTIIRQARAEGREVTREEILAVVSVNDSARANLVEAIERAG